MQGARAHTYARAAGAKIAAHARNSTTERLLILHGKNTQHVAHKMDGNTGSPRTDSLAQNHNVSQITLVGDHPPYGRVPVLKVEPLKRDPETSSKTILLKFPPCSEQYFGWIRVAK